MSRLARAIIKSAPSGSTAPVSTPPTKAHQRDIPWACSGREMMAPSGRFCMAMPSASDIAPMAVMPARPVR